jgi:uracil phosphoribosyltransferase
MPIHEIRHPLVRHKLGLMRRADLSTKNFREMAQEIAALLTYEAMKDLPLEPVRIEGCAHTARGHWHAGWRAQPDSGGARQRGRYRPQ